MAFFYNKSLLIYFNYTRVINHKAEQTRNDSLYYRET